MLDYEQRSWRGGRQRDQSNIVHRARLLQITQSTTLSKRERRTPSCRVSICVLGLQGMLEGVLTKGKDHQYPQ